MISQPVSSIFLFSTALWDLANSRPVLELREILLSFQIGFSLVNAAVVCAILESISGLEPSSVITEPRYLKLVTVSSFCPFTLISVLMPLGAYTMMIRTRCVFAASFDTMVIRTRCVFGGLFDIMMIRTRCVLAASFDTMMNRTRYILAAFLILW